MKNFEKNFDRALSALKECNEILKECNNEMRETLAGSKSLCYAIADKDRTQFYNSDFNTFMCDICGATYYRTKSLARAIMEEFDLSESDFDIIVVSIKVVE